ncbi:hypothetical protein [Sunxiuqinia indica]|uniref:hypothetical protein n=1 Tax=Sunxiuqinia indica TaxID=2692584 RepID=UPI00135B6E17|nr:hypothetical protein [Sunxiuqinia indica]
MKITVKSMLLCGFLLALVVSCDKKDDEVDTSKVIDNVFKDIPLNDIESNKAYIVDNDISVTFSEMIQKECESCGLENLEYYFSDAYEDGLTNSDGPGQLYIGYGRVVIDISKRSSPKKILIEWWPNCSVCGTMFLYDKDENIIIRDDHNGKGVLTSYYTTGIEDVDFIVISAFETLVKKVSLEF